MKSIFAHRSKLSLGAFFLVSIFLAKEHFQGGIITHNLLAREDLPGISNGWGLLTVPLLAWVVATIIKRRYQGSAQKPEKYEQDVLKRFLAALLFGITASILWEFGLENVLQYFILLPLLIALVTPVHWAECLLGFVLGMLYTFGGILPILLGLILLILSFLINSLQQFLKSLLLPKHKT